MIAQIYLLTELDVSSRTEIEIFSKRVILFSNDDGFHHLIFETSVMLRLVLHTVVVMYIMATYTYTIYVCVYTLVVVPMDGAGSLYYDSG